MKGLVSVRFFTSKESLSLSLMYKVTKMERTLIEIVHHIYIDFGVKPCHEHVNSQLGKNNLRLQLEKKMSSSD